MALESPTHLHVGLNIGGVSNVLNTEASPYPLKFRKTHSDEQHHGASPSSSSRNFVVGEREICSMSSTFEEVLNGYTKEMDAAKPESRVDRIMDAFRRGESMLLSNDNLRPKSRCKTTLNNLDHHHKFNGSSSLERPKSFTNTLKLRTFSQSPDHTKCSNLLVDVNDNLVNLSNNADNTEKFSPKKGKKYKKRAKSEGKGKRNKPSKTPIQSPAKYSSTPSVFPQSNSHASRRISSETHSKETNSSSITHTVMQGTGLENRHKLKALSITNTRATKEGAPAPISIIKYKTTSLNSTPVTHYSHGNRPLSSPVIDNDLGNRFLFTQGMPITVHKPQMRIKSGHSTHSEDIGRKSPTSTKEEDLKDNLTVHSDQLLVLNAKPINVQRTRQAVSPNGAQRKHLQQVLSADMNTRQASLEAIYGAMHNTANRITAQVEELKKVKKIFLSDRQSGTIKENGLEYPCAPPATPNPDAMRKVEYVPSMADIRSQRAVKGRLQAMEKDAQKKKEKQKESALKLEKQFQKEREKMLKAKQRREIYALNKVMTDLEHKRFLEFCKSKGLNKT